ncbi:leucyl aminopeptidase [Mesobacterium sp. TK19101]|uniref:Probable cytosol aminopeptidase n=1 Tax=Mesobacterium hydrothermale TaxID=3111907 RepID=A0ABU6HDU7_9RHOB|nr:leucyl aminopeptidase [Mesobacterium sp. TK19101]MEC3860639.1 leucyl aminopeptidase [Mesobacterium sp. TK19101]
MTDLRSISFSAPDQETIAEANGHVAIFVDADGKLDALARKVNTLTRGAVKRVVEGAGWDGKKPGQVQTLSYPAGLAADALHIICLPRRPTVIEARKAGAMLAKAAGKSALTLLCGTLKRAEDLAMGLALRSYDFTDHKSDKGEAPAAATVQVNDPAAAEAAFAPLAAVAEGIFFTRDLVNEPANVLTTTEFANRLDAMAALGLEVEVLEEDRLAELKMGALLAVGQGSASPSKVVVMRWTGGGEAAPLALVGKGVVFDTGGISLKPAGGMEDMTMDMGGAGVVAGTMMALAKRKAQANVVGLVGLVENMPSGAATRPGDVVTSMKGDTIEVINTDAEGRLVLCDVMWYAQETFKPAAMIDLATLTGACIIALGHENAAVYVNDDPLAKNLLSAAEVEGEGAWRMPLGQAYDDMLKSPIADMKNVGGRPAGSITAAQFLKRFVQDGTPWAHIDIAGVAHRAGEHDLGPRGATGWGVMALNRLVRDSYEG